jgi:hypothetical protein
MLERGTLPNYLFGSWGGAGGRRDCPCAPGVLIPALMTHLSRFLREGTC